MSSNHISTAVNSSSNSRSLSLNGLAKVSTQTATACNTVEAWDNVGLIKSEPRVMAFREHVLTPEEVAELQRRIDHPSAPPRRPSRVQKVARTDTLH